MQILKKQICFIDTIINFVKSISEEENERKLSIEKDFCLLNELQYKYSINNLKLPDNIVLLDMYIYYSSLLNNLEKTLCSEEERLLFQYMIIEKYMSSNFYTKFENIPQNHYSLINEIHDKATKDNVVFVEDEKMLINNLYEQIKTT